MKAVIQRVTHADVKVDGKTVGEISSGLLLLIGINEIARTWGQTCASFQGKPFKSIS